MEKKFRGELEKISKVLDKLDQEFLLFTDEANFDLYFRKIDKIFELHSICREIFIIKSFLTGYRLLIINFVHFSPQHALEAHQKVRVFSVILHDWCFSLFSFLFQV